jgi:23S rRNA pseudouridine1911/1915/1917 synthase
MDERDVVVEGAAERFDRWLRRALPGLSRRLIHTLIAEGSVRVDGRRATKGFVVQPGVHVTVPAQLTLTPNPSLGLSVLYEDAFLIAIDKPGGLPSHPLDPRERDTVANFVLARYPETAPLGGGLTHRLDTGTSGVLLAARTLEHWHAVRAAFRDHVVAKRYLALVPGTVPAETTVDLPLSHDPRDRRRMVPARPGLRAWPAVSVVRRVASGGATSLVSIVMHTGVTHQIRVHLASLGHPVVGDALYGGPPADLPSGRHALHGADLTLPALGGCGPVTIQSPLAADLVGLMTPPADSP